MSTSAICRVTTAVFLLSFTVSGHAQAPTSVPLQSTVPESINIDRTQQLLANAKKLVAVDADGCLATNNPDEIVVCGSFDANRKHRLPFPELAADTGQRQRVPIPNGNPEIVQQGRCYVTMSERNCFKGLSIFSASFGGRGGSVSGPAGRLWRVIQPTVPDEDYVKQVQIQENDSE